MACVLGKAQGKINLTITNITSDKMRVTVTQFFRHLDIYLTWVQAFCSTSVVRF